MPDPSMSMGGDDASSTAPPPTGGAVPSGGGAETAGMAPPTGAPGAVDGSVPNQGLESLGMEIMRKAMAAIHIGRSLLNPYSEEGKAADTMFRHGAKHFKPDSSDVAKGSMPNVNQVGAPQGQQPPGGPPQMAPQGAGAMPQPPTGPIPSLAGANQ